MGNFVFIGTAPAGSVVVVVDLTSGLTLANGSADAAGDVYINVSVATLTAGDQLALRTGGVNGPGSAPVTVLASPQGTPTPAVSTGVPAAAGAVYVTLQGMAGQAVLIVDMGTHAVLGQGSLPLNGLGAVAFSPPLGSGQTVQALVGGLAGPSFSAVAALPPPSVVSGSVLVDGSTLVAQGQPGAVIQVIDAQGRILGQATADSSGRAALNVAGGSPGVAVALAQDGVKLPLPMAAMAMGSQSAILSQNIFRPGTGSLGIVFKAPVDEHLTIKVFNLAGELVRSVAEMDVTAGGTYQAQWDGANRWGQSIASGVYFVSLHGPSTHVLKKVVVLR